MVGRGLVLSVAALCASTTFAHAECADPFWVGTRPGSFVPPRGDLYVYREVPQYASYRARAAGELTMTLPGSPFDEDFVVDARWTGGDGLVTQSRVSSKVIKVHYEGAAGSELVLGKYWNYRLTSQWRVPDTAPRAMMARHDAGYWTCSSWDVLHITLDQPTAAVRVRWTFTGQQREWLIPTHASYDDDGRDQLSLGKLSCGGTTLPPKELAIGGSLELVAIRHDGTEVPVIGVPKYTATYLLREAHHLDDDDVVNPTRSTEDTSTWPRYALACALLAVGAWFTRRASRARAALPYPR